MAVHIPDFNLSAFAGLASSVFADNNGAVMGKLDDFAFFMHKNDFKQIQESMTADFSSYKPIKGQELLGDSGGFSHNITLNGVLVAEPIEGLNPLKFMLMERKPLQFTTLTFDYDVVMVSYSPTKQSFGLIGDHRVESYNIVLKRIYGDLL